MLSHIAWYVQLCFILAASTAVWKRYRSTGDKGYAAVFDVIVGVQLCLNFAKMWTWLWFAGHLGPSHSFQGVANGFAAAVVFLTSLGVVVALYVVDRQPGSGNVWHWLWSENAKLRSSEELVR